jgi:predicted alpha/beta superfamily hydrolase
MLSLSGLLHTANHERCGAALMRSVSWLSCLVVVACTPPGAMEPRKADVVLVGDHIGEEIVDGARLPTPDIVVVPDVVSVPDRIAVPDAAPTPTVLRVRYSPGDAPMALRGSLHPLTWERGVTFTRTAPDTWEWRSTELSAPLEWKPLLEDRTWSRGPNYRALPGSTVEVFPHFTTVVGEFARTYPSVMSTVLGNRRGVWVYLPPTYRENSVARFPVVYMHDGQNLFDPRAAFGGVAWDADGAMNTGAENGTLREAIIVGVENNADRIAEYTPTRDASIGMGGRADLYLRMLVEEIKPMIDRTYRTLPSREHTAIVGSSLGGLVSMYAGVRRPEVFGLVGALSPSTWWDERVILREVATIATRPLRPLRIYVDSGDAGTSRDGVSDTRDLAAALRSVGFVEGTTLRYVVQPGATHTERYWAERLPGAFAFLLGAR